MYAFSAFSAAGTDLSVKCCLSLAEEGKEAVQEQYHGKVHSPP